MDIDEKVNDKSLPTLPPAPPVPPPDNSSLAKWLMWAVRYLAIIIASGATVGAGVYMATAPKTPATPDLVVPPEIRGEPATAIIIKADTTGTHVRWRAVDRGLTLVKIDRPKEIVAVASRAGRYRVECWSAVRGEPTAIVTTTIIVTDEPGPQPSPPDPPGPDPKPPVPPNPPNPPQPGPPTSPLTAKLQAAYSADKASVSVKLQQKASLTGMYLAMVDHAKKPEITSTDDLLADLKALSAAMVPPGALVECRKIIADEITAALGDGMGQKLDPDMRPKAIDVFARIAKSLAEVKA